MAKHYLFLDNDGDKALSVGGRIFGSDGAQTIQLLEHAAPAVIANSVERVEFATDVAGYKFKGLGTKVKAPACPSNRCTTIVVPRRPHRPGPPRFPQWKWLSFLLG